jgi:hypothetical protein
VQRMLAAMTSVPAYVANSRLDVIGANDLARAAFWPMLDSGAVPNLIRYAFIDVPDASAWPDWDAIADELVAKLRAATGRDPHDKALTELADELAAASAEFRRRWASRDVHGHGSGVMRYVHPAAGELALGYETFEFVTEPGLVLRIYHAEPGSLTADALPLLAAWYAGKNPRDADASERDAGCKARPAGEAFQPARDGRPGSRATAPYGTPAQGRREQRESSLGPQTRSGTRPAGKRSPRTVQFRRWIGLAGSWFESMRVSSILTVSSPLNCEDAGKERIHRDAASAHGEQDPHTCLVIELTTARWRRRRGSPLARRRSPGGWKLMRPT